MGQALYRKYRPKSFEDAIGQSHITDTLKKAIKSGKISHAYLFTGPRGVGKTSIARILAHEVNSIPYSDESVHLDIIEIDAASNRRIDEIRDLRDKVNISPTSAKYKVYIIDEVHMLTKEAFNALLKTLEEPPAHCIFILATTEAHKLPETIISRTQRFEFKPISTSDAVTQLSTIAKAEKIKADTKALELIAEHGLGSFRDSIGLLDQLNSYAEGGITIDNVRQFLGLPSSQTIDALYESINSGHADKVLSSLVDLRQEGTDFSYISSSLARKLRKAYIDNPDLTYVPGLLKQLINLPLSHDPDQMIEIILLEAAIANRPKDKPVEPTSSPTPEPEQATPGIHETVDESSDPEILPNKTEPVAQSSSKHQAFNTAVWEEILLSAREKDASIYTALRLAEPRIDKQKLVLAFKFPLHQKKVDQARHKDLIAKLVEEKTGQKLQIVTVVDKQSKSKDSGHKSGTEKNSDDIKNISNIFGDAKVLES